MINFLRRVFGKTGGWVVLEGALNSSFRFASSIWRQKTIPEMEATHETQLIVYVCVNAIARAIQEAPLCVGRSGTKDDSMQRLKGHWAEDLLLNPNPEMHGAEYLWHVAAHLVLTGMSYVYKRRDLSGGPAQVWPLPTSWVTPIRDKKSGEIIMYKLYQGVGRPKLEVPPEDVFRMILPHPADLSCGLGPLQPAGRDVQMDDERADYFVEMIANRKQPGTIFHQPDGWSEDEKTEAANNLKSYGKGNRGRPFFLSGQGAKIEMVDAMKELDWPGLSGLNETRICAAFGVPPIVAGLRSGLENATYSNFETAKRVFFSQTIAPLWGLIADGHTKGLLHDEGEDGDAVYADTSAVAALRESQDELAKRVCLLAEKSVIKRKTAQTMLGITPDPAEPDGYLTPMGV